MNSTAFVMLAITFFGNSDQVQDYRPVSEHLYASEAECKADIPNQELYHPELKTSGEKVECAEVQRNSEY